MSLASECEVVSYLARKGYVNARHIVATDFSVTDISRHHRNFKIALSAQCGLILKEGIGSDRGHALAREARVLSWLNEQRGISDYVPQLVEFDEEEQIVLIELVANAYDLRHYHLTHGYFPVTLARSIGNILGKLHKADVTTANQIDKVHLPWVFNLHLPSLAFYRECSHANLELIKLVQEFPDYCQQLDLLRTEWEQKCCIHKDIKWDNFLVHAAPGAQRVSRTKLIDWELAGLGDPCWDIGSFFCEYLTLWSMSVPLAEDMPTDGSVGLARFQLEKMTPAVSIFWETYSQVMAFDATTNSACLIRSIRFAAARLLQKTFEQLQELTQLTETAESMLQLSANMLERPVEAGIHLLGLRIEKVRE